MLRNRATLAERGGQWATALGFAVDAYAYVSGTAADESSRETLEGRVNNCVSALMESRRWADAVALADEAIAAYGQSDGFAALRKVASLAYLTDALRNAAGQEALALADEAAAAGEADAAWLDRAYAWAYGSLADERRKAGDHLGAWKTAAEGAARFPASGELARLELAARSNWVKDSHNRFAASYNAGDYAQALALIESALAVAPGEHVLVEDERVARAALGHLQGVVSSLAVAGKRIAIMAPFDSRRSIVPPSWPASASTRSMPMPLRFPGLAALMVAAYPTPSSATLKS